MTSRNVIDIKKNQPEPDLAMGARVRELRTAAAMSQAELAAKFGSAQQTIQGIESRGHHSKLLPLIARHFRVSTDWLIFGVGPKGRPEAGHAAPVYAMPRGKAVDALQFPGNLTPISHCHGIPVAASERAYVLIAPTGIDLLFPELHAGQWLFIDPMAAADGLSLIYREGWSAPELREVVRVGSGCTLTYRMAGETRSEQCALHGPDEYQHALASDTSAALSLGRVVFVDRKGR